MSTLIIVPAYNEEKTISNVILRIHNYTKNVVVVDDGSHDQTAQLAQNHNCIVLRHCVNRGLGAALRTGFAYALDHQCDYVITFDADGQHDASDIPRLISKLQEGYDVVVGSRMHTTTHMPLMRIIANKIGNFVTYGGQIGTDSQSGLRGFRTSALSALELYTDRMEISSEIIEEVVRKKLRYGEISIQPIYTDYSLSKGQSFLVGLATWWRLLCSRVFK